MAYIAGSTAVDGRGKILLGQQALELFDATAPKGFLGHVMAHLVSDRAAQGCNNYIVRDPQMEADADAFSGACARKATCQGVLDAGAGTHRRSELGRKTPTGSAAMILTS